MKKKLEEINGLKAVLAGLNEQYEHLETTIKKANKKIAKASLFFQNCEAILRDVRAFGIFRSRRRARISWRPTKAFRSRLP